MAILANSLTCCPWHSRPGVFAILYGCAQACVSRVIFFANRVSDNAKAKGVPTGDLIRRFQRGQSRAFEALYDRFKDYVYRTAFFITRNSGDAEEAVQETFLDVLRALPHYRVESSTVLDILEGFGIQLPSQMYYLYQSNKIKLSLL